LRTEEELEDAGNFEYQTTFDDLPLEIKVMIGRHLVRCNKYTYDSDAIVHTVWGLIATFEEFPADSMVISPAILQAPLFRQLLVRTRFVALPLRCGFEWMRFRDNIDIPLPEVLPEYVEKRFNLFSAKIVRPETVYYLARLFDSIDVLDLNYHPQHTEAILDALYEEGIKIEYLTLRNFTMNSTGQLLSHPFFARQLTRSLHLEDIVFESHLYLGDLQVTRVLFRHCVGIVSLGTYRGAVTFASSPLLAVTGFGCTQACSIIIEGGVYALPELYTIPNQTRVYLEYCDDVTPLYDEVTAMQSRTRGLDPRLKKRAQRAYCTRMEKFKDNTLSSDFLDAIYPEGLVRRNFEEIYQTRPPVWVV
jgi:hypothetical protein